jgi:proteasome lid subunit RPN8/RPN11
MLIIDQEARQFMIRDAEQTFPNECCGFMFGREEGADRYVTTARPVENAREGDKRKRFEISSIDYMHAEQYAEQKNLSLLGIYHSHPNHPAIASETDRLAAQPFFSYVIISVRNAVFAELRSWRLNNDQQFEKEPVAHGIISQS